MDDIKNSHKTLLSILSKAYAVLSIIDKNNELHFTHPHVEGIGVFKKFPYFLMTNSFISEYLLIIIFSFLDEYNDHFIPSKSVILADRITTFRRQVKPILTRINKWTDLKNYRNIVLAHNLRVKNNVSIYKSDNKIDFNIPNQYDQIVLICELLALITNNIGIEFPELRKEIDFNETLGNKFNIPTISIDFNKEYNDICEQIKILGLTYTQRTKL